MYKRNEKGQEFRIEIFLYNKNNQTAFRQFFFWSGDDDDDDDNNDDGLNQALKRARRWPSSSSSSSSSRSGGSDAGIDADRRRIGLSSSSSNSGMETARCGGGDGRAGAISSADGKKNRKAKVRWYRNEYGSFLIKICGFWRFTYWWNTVRRSRLD